MKRFVLLASTIIAVASHQFGWSGMRFGRQRKYFQRSPKNENIRNIRFLPIVRKKFSFSRQGMNVDSEEEGMDRRLPYIIVDDDNELHDVFSHIKFENVYNTKTSNEEHNIYKELMSESNMSDATDSYFPGDDISKNEKHIINAVKNEQNVNILKSKNFSTAEAEETDDRSPLESAADYRKTFQLATEFLPTYSFSNTAPPVQNYTKQPEYFLENNTYNMENQYYSWKDPNALQEQIWNVEKNILQPSRNASSLGYNKNNQPNIAKSKNGVDFNIKKPPIKGKLVHKFPGTDHVTTYDNVPETELYPVSSKSLLQHPINSDWIQKYYMNAETGTMQIAKDNPHSFSQSRNVNTGNYYNGTPYTTTRNSALSKVIPKKYSYTLSPFAYDAAKIGLSEPQYVTTTSLYNKSMLNANMLPYEQRPPGDSYDKPYEHRGLFRNISLANFSVADLAKNLFDVPLTIDDITNDKSIHQFIPKNEWQRQAKNTEESVSGVLSQVPIKSYILMADDAAQNYAAIKNVLQEKKKNDDYYENYYSNFAFLLPEKKKKIKNKNSLSAEELRTLKNHADVPPPPLPSNNSSPESSNITKNMFKSGYRDFINIVRNS